MQKQATTNDRQQKTPVKAADLSPFMILGQLKAYVSMFVQQRGFNNTSRDIVLLLVEEVGELAKSIRKSIGLKIDQQKTEKYPAVEEEIADVFFHLLGLCNVLDVDLFKALKNKALKNETRFWRK